MMRIIKQHSSEWLIPLRSKCWSRISNLMITGMIGESGYRKYAIIIGKETLQWKKNTQHCIQFCFMLWHRPCITTLVSRLQFWVESGGLDSRVEAPGIEAKSRSSSLHFLPPSQAYTTSGVERSTSIPRLYPVWAWKPGLFLPLMWLWLSLYVIENWFRQWGFALQINRIIIVRNNYLMKNETVQLLFLLSWPYDFIS